jgi:hypothetical protein
MEQKKLLIEPTHKTPLIDFNHLTGELIMSGKSIPENAAGLYENVLKWVTEYIQGARQTTNLRLSMEYFNTASTIWITKIVKVLCSINKPECTLLIHLYFDIEEYDSMEVEDLKDILIPIIDKIGVPVISLGVKIYGIDEKGEALKESMVLV